MTAASPASTHVLLDSENLFWGFGALRSADPLRTAEARRRRVVFFPRVPDDLARCLGAIVAVELVDWLEARYALVSRLSYGKYADPGVTTVLDELQDRGFAHHSVPRGKDRADRALIAEMHRISERGDARGHMTLGSGDGSILDAAVALRNADTSWRFFAIVPDSVSHNVRRSHRGRHSALKVTGLDVIHANQRAQRRGDAAARAAHRVLLADVLGRVRARSAAEQRPSASWTLGAAVVAIAKGAPFPSPHRVARAEWAADVGARFASILDETAATTLVGWAAVEIEERMPKTDDALTELLFRAAIATTVGDRMDAVLAGLLRRAVRDSDVSRLTVLERALSAWGPAAL